MQVRKRGRIACTACWAAAWQCAECRTRTCRFAGTVGRRVKTSDGPPGAQSRPRECPTVNIHRNRQVGMDCNLCAPCYRAACTSLRPTYACPLSFGRYDWARDAQINGNAVITTNSHLAVAFPLFCCRTARHRPIPTVRPHLRPVERSRMLERREPQGRVEQAASHSPNAGHVCSKVDKETAIRIVSPYWQSQ